jgi:hypothetical protein
VQTAPPESFVVTVIETPTREVTLADVIFGSFGVVGALVALALVLGAGLAVLFVLWRKRHPPEDDHMPSVSPLIEPAADGRPSYPAR